METLGGLDGVVNSAGIAADIPALDTPVDLFRKILDVNVIGTFIVARAAARLMKDKGGGAIVNLASVSGLRGGKGRSAYGASKGAVVVLTQVLANDLARHGIRVNAIAPGPTDTPMVKAVHADADRELWKRYVPMRRYADPGEIATAIEFLLDGTKSSYITGEILPSTAASAAPASSRRSKSHANGSREARHLPQAARERLLRHPQPLGRRHREISGASGLQGAGVDQRGLCLVARASATAPSRARWCSATSRKSRRSPMCLSMPTSRAAMRDEPEGVAESVRLCCETGVSGLSIEDYTGKKDTPLYDFDLAVARIKAARAAIDKAGGGVLLTGRSEGFIRNRPDLDETIKRLKAYADAGADVLYSPGIATREQISAVVKAVAPKPVNLLIGGPSDLTVSDVTGLGVRRISVGGALARAAWGGFLRTAKQIAEQGSFKGFADAAPGGEIMKGLLR